MLAGFEFFITELHFLIGRVDLQVDLMARLDPKIYFHWIISIKYCQLRYYEFKAKIKINFHLCTLLLKTNILLELLA
ncbi:hypothetical protein NC653_002373 [Populus alba x Populus x berolinensis]|uniref:Uncharacterized protein n=1 Tax=Populus alba x Populus x berolinensis TaxID=444605 RepID=A0AAD6WGR5_9ROSI|nr:hypothetical protein NC653_002373 [Populus alba x Populus x berolinensis]